MAKVDNSKSPGVTKLMTDSSGRGWIERETDSRPNMENFKNPDKIAGNYYPITNRASIESETEKMTIITDRAHGGASLSPGSLELMIQGGLQRFRIV